MEKRLPTRLSPAEGRKFALTLSAAFAVLSGILWWRDHLMVARFTGAGALLLLGAGLLIPGRLGPVQRGWMAFGLAISKVTTPVVMGILYYAVLTPTGAIRRTFGASPLRTPPGFKSAWSVRDADKRRGDLTRPF